MAGSHTNCQVSEVSVGWNLINSGLIGSASAEALKVPGEAQAAEHVCHPIAEVLHAFCGSQISPTNKHGSAKRPFPKRKAVFLQGSVHQTMLAGGRVKMRAFDP